MGYRLRQANYSVAVVEHDIALRQQLVDALDRQGYHVSDFTFAEDCIKHLSTNDSCDLLITTLHLPKMNGIELLKTVKTMAPWVSVVIMSGHADIPTAMEAVNNGAADFIVKPFDISEVLHKLDNILKRFEASTGEMLTSVERRILTMIMDGLSNKEIARKTHRSVRTVEVHRSHIMHKIHAHNIVELVQKAAAK